MSHQDTGRDSRLVYNHQALHRAVLWLVAGVSWAGVCFRRGCTWTPRFLVLTCLLWVWSDEKTLTHRFAAARKVARRMCPRREAPAGSYQAFTKLLRKWTATLVAALQRCLRELMRQRLPQRFWQAGFIPFGVDGSRFGLPRTASHERAFAPSKKRRKAEARRRRTARRGQRQSPPTAAQQAAWARGQKGAGPQLWVTVLWHLGCGLPWSWRFGPSDSSEREHLRDMLPELPPQSLLVADAGFTGYELWRALAGVGCEMIVRVGSNIRLLRKLGYVKERDDLVYLWKNHAAQQGQPPLVLRLVVIHNGRHPVYLVTTVLNHRRLSNQQVIDFYRLRWGIEVFYRHLKQTYEWRKLRSRAAANVPVEATWTLLGLWAMAFYAECHLQERDIPPTRLSMAQVLRAFRQPLREYKSRPDPGETLHELLERAIIDVYSRPSKTSRDYPRKRTETAAGPPRIVAASSAQKRRAQEICRKIELRLTA